MLNRNRISAAFLATAALSCKSLPKAESSLQSNGVPLGEFRGYAAVSRDVETLFFGSTVPAFAPRSYAVQAELQRVMGSFHSGVKQSQYLGGQPNGGNFLLWAGYFDTLLTEFMGVQCPKPGAAPPVGNGSFGSLGNSNLNSNTNNNTVPNEAPGTPPPANNTTGIAVPIISAGNGIAQPSTDGRINSTAPSDSNQSGNYGGYPQVQSKTPLGIIVKDFCNPAAKKDELRPLAKSMFAQFVSLPDRRLEPWESYFWGDQFTWTNNQEAVREMLMALLMDPYFLLERQ